MNSIKQGIHINFENLCIYFQNIIVWFEKVRQCYCIVIIDQESASCQ